jgi:hypothetical protein
VNGEESRDLIRRPVQRGVDAMCVLGLVAIVLFGFDQTFGDREYLVTGMAGAVVVVAAGIVVTALAGARTDVFLLVAALLYVPVGALAAFRPLSQGRLPAGDELIEVLTATLSGTEVLLTTIPPVDAVGPVLVLPYSVGYLSAGAALWLAIRTRRPLAPVLPLLAGFAGVIALGPLTSSDRTLLIGTGFSAIALWWGSWRAADPASRDVALSGASRGRLGRALAAALVVGVAASAALTVVPTTALEEERTVLRGRLGRGASVDQLDNPLISFRRFTDQDDGSPDNAFAEVLFSVSGLEEVRAIRFVTLDLYDGTAWRAGNRTVDDADDDLFQRIGSEVSAPRSGDAVTVQIDLRTAYRGGWLPLVGQLTGVNFDFADGRAQREDVRYNPATSSATVLGGLGPGDDYTFTATVPTERLAANSEAYPTDGPLMTTGSALDDYLAPYATSGEPPLQQVLQLARYLRRNGRYSDGAGALIVPRGHDINRLTAEFIGADRIVGNDEQYAAFLALAANRLGVPARVVVGAFADDGKVRGRNVSAWVELRVRDGSWRTLPTTEFMSMRRPRRDDEPPQSLSEYVEQQAGQQSDPDALESGPSPGLEPGPDDSTAADASDAGSSGDFPLGWLLLVSGLAWLVPGLKQARRAVRRTRARTSSRVAGAWAELTDAALDLGHAVPTGATRERQGALLGVEVRLAQHADDLVFAAEVPSGADADYYWRAVDQARRDLRAGHPWPRRLLAVFSPQSLIAAARARRA